jgi:hypothetical protein
VLVREAVVLEADPEQTYPLDPQRIHQPHFQPQFPREVRALHTTPRNGFHDPNTRNTMHQYPTGIQTMKEAKSYSERCLLAELFFLSFDFRFILSNFCDIIATPWIP